MNGHDIFNLLEAVAATSKRTEKEALLAAHKHAPLLQRVLKLAYDPFITFGVTAPRVAGAGPRDLAENPTVFELLAELEQRRLTGNLAKDAVKSMILDSTPSSGELIRRILNKDLRAGFTANTINRVFEPGFIEVFEVMLAKPFEEHRVKAWPVAVEPKLDGVRVAGIVEHGRAQFLSRNGKEFPGLAHLEPHLVSVAERALEKARGRGVDAVGKYLAGDQYQLGAGPAVFFDGEVTSGNFNDTVGDARRAGEASDAVYSVFDILPLAPFRDPKRETISLTYRQRRAVVEFVTGAAIDGSPVKAIPRYLAGSIDEVMGLYERFRDAKLEGAIVKPLDGAYHKKRAFEWMKMKAEETEDLRITGWFLGKDGTRLEGRFAGFTVDRQGVQVRVGGGISEAWREEIEKEPGAYVGRLLEVEYHEVTPDGSLRHPRAVRLRDDKDKPAKDAA